MRESSPETNDYTQDKRKRIGVTRRGRRLLFPPPKKGDTLSEIQSPAEKAVQALRLSAELLSIGLFPGGVAQEVYRCKEFLLLLAKEQGASTKGDTSGETL